MPHLAVLTKIQSLFLNKCSLVVAISCLIFRVLNKLMAVSTSVLAALMEEWICSGLYFAILKVLFYFYF